MLKTKTKHLRAAFKFVWNITPEIREKMATFKAANKEEAPAIEE